MKPVEIEATYGTSVEIKGLWHKFSFSMKVALEDGDDVSLAKEKLWNTVIAEVEKQITALVGGE